MMKPLKVCIDARLMSGVAGGVEQVIIGLAHGLSKLTDGQEEYYFLTYADEDAWIRPYVSGACRLLYGAKAPRSSDPSNSSTRCSFLQKIYPANQIREIRNLWSDGTIEKANIDIMHFTHQTAFLTKVASLYHPHDLQHQHFPQYFNWRTRLAREVRYRMFCRRAQLVPVVSSYIKADIVRSYHLSKEKVRIIPLAPALSAYQKPTSENRVDFQRKFSLPDAFILYPAQMWPHKNHLGLLKAMAILRERHGMIVSAVFTGSKIKTFFPTIEKQVHALGLSEQTFFLGFVTPLELQCLYSFAKGIVIPTLYEAGSFPLLEAFVAGVPAACSNVTSLPAQAGEAALIFNPNKPEEIADAIARLYTDKSLRQILIERGYRNAVRYSWERTARMFRACYRSIAKRSLTEEDQALLIETRI